MSWNYSELIESFVEEYEEYKLEYQSPNEAVARAFEEHYSEKNSDDMEKAVLMVISAEFKVKQPRIYKNTKENYIKDLELIDFQKLKDFIQKGQLNEKEYEELYLRRNKVLQELEKMTVDLCPKARWFYDEIVDIVNRYFSEKENENNIIEIILKNFEREFRYKACAKKIVYTTIAENLIRIDETIPPYIISELEDRYVDNSQYELTEKEERELLRRIDEVLKEVS
ncbi:Imm3 family immunity protein [Paenibacillus xylanexedens]|uniref:Imm3 family immunity protein n=1 Tax=Paenibacillus xylanexedens TaxID=528191 RepID=UPI00119D4A26|nr:Imm3 family immunity protein [Paenibacillus xylanexedens]